MNTRIKTTLTWTLLVLVILGFYALLAWLGSRGHQAAEQPEKSEPTITTTTNAATVTIWRKTVGKQTQVFGAAEIEGRTWILLPRYE